MSRPYVEAKTDYGVKRFELFKRPLTIGRNSGNAIMLSDQRASRFHCVIEPTPRGYQVRDLESRNGTLVNGLPVHTAILRPGDLIEVGDTAVRFLTEAPVAVWID